jgi:glutathione S-transferase
MTPSIKLTYFDIEGVAESVRLALVLSGTPFEDDRIASSQWAELKPKTPYGALPVMTIDGGPQRTQSMAQLRYVASSFSKTLYPSDKLLDIEESMGVVQDITQSWMPNLYMGMRPANFGYPADFAQSEEGKAKIKEMREKWTKEELPKFLDRIEGLLNGSGGKWLVAGDEPTIADCSAVPLLRYFTRGHVDHVDATCLDSHPKIVEYIKRFCALDAIQGRYTNGIC